jgi:hypothetical protein
MGQRVAGVPQRLAPRLRDGAQIATGILETQRSVFKAANQDWLDRQTAENWCIPRFLALSLMVRSCKRGFWEIRV